MIYYFIGIKGSGMASLAEVMFDLGYNEMGSDKSEHFFTEDGLVKKGIKILEFNKDNIKDGMTIIQGNAFNDEHEEVIRAHELNLKMKFEEEKDILQMELWELFPTKIVNILYHKNIYKIKDLIKYKISDLEKIHYLTNYIKFIVDIVHRYGLNFQDEITEEQRLENYQKYIESLGSIVEEKSNVRKLKQ